MAVSAYYSVVQYCPDVCRMETVNVGVVVSCPVLSLLGAAFTDNHSRVERLFGPINEHALNAAEAAIGERLEVEKDRLLRIDELEKFIGTRANLLHMTPLRPWRIDDLEADFEKLYADLVLDPLDLG